MSQGAPIVKLVVKSSLLGSYLRHSLQQLLEIVVHLASAPQHHHNHKSNESHYDVMTILTLIEDINFSAPL